MVTPLAMIRALTAPDIEYCATLLRLIVVTARPGVPPQGRALIVIELLRLGTTLGRTWENFTDGDGSMTRPTSRHVGSSMRNNRMALAAGLAALVVLLLSLLAYCQWSGSGTDNAAPGPSTTTTRPAPSGSGTTGAPGTTGGATANGAATGGATANGAATATRTATGGATANGGATGAAPGGSSSGDVGADSVSTSDPAAPSGAPHTGGGGGLGMRSPALAGAGIVLLLAATALVVFRRRPQTTGI